MLKSDILQTSSGLTNNILKHLSPIFQKLEGKEFFLIQAQLWIDLIQDYLTLFTELLMKLSVEYN